MRYYLSSRAVLKWLETPSLYHLGKDELYELDAEAFRFLRGCMTGDGCLCEDSAFIDYCMDEDIITTEKVSANRPALLESPAPSLRYLELQITDACNVDCKHCYISNSSGSELSAMQVRRILTEFAEMQGLRVLITGGEPLLHSAFEEINEMLPDFFLRTVLFTNGVLLKKELLTKLHVDEIQVSLDGLEEAHDALRGPGTFRLAMEAVHRALDAGFDVSIATMVHQRNLSQFDTLEQLFRKMAIKDWTVDVPCPSGRLAEHDDLRVSPGEGGKFLGYGFGGGFHSSGRGFGCGLHLIAALADGGIAKCTFYSGRAVGTVDEGLRAAWGRTVPVLLKDLSCDCAFLEVCRGGCRYRAELLHGRGAKDEYRCMLYGVLSDNTHAGDQERRTRP